MRNIGLFIIGILLISFLSGCEQNYKDVNTDNLQSTSTLNTSAQNISERSTSAQDTSTQNTVMNNTTDNSETNKTKNNVTYDKLSLVADDFNIDYRNIVINDKIPFEQIAKKLNIVLGSYDFNDIDVKSSCSVGDNEYRWLVVHYPSKENEEIRIEYVMNETLKTGYLVTIYLCKVKTNRDVGIGDDVKQLLESYGDYIEPETNTKTAVFRYKINKNSGSSDKTITFYTDIKTKKIKDIKIIYNNDKAMDELGITSFD